MAEINRCIKCCISNCKHNDNSEYCKLDKISVGGETCCTDCRETECRSFELE